MLHEKDHNTKRTQKLNVDQLSDIQRAFGVAKNGVIKSVKVGIEWIIGMPKNLYREQNTGLLETLHRNGVEPNDVVTFRLVMTGVALCIYAFLDKDAGALMYIGLNILDAVDGKLARAFEQTSSEGEKFDAGADKIVVVAGDIVALSQIAHPVIATQAIMSYLANWELLRESFVQRGPIREQLSLFKGLMLGTISPTYQEKKTPLAATAWGKYKTICQMVSNSALLVSGTATFQRIVQESMHQNIFQASCVTLSMIAIVLGYKSVQGRK